MTGELTRWESDGESLLQSLERDEIFEYLSEGFCRQCKSLLQTRIHSLVNQKVREREIRPKSNNGDIEGSRFLNRQRQETRFTQIPVSSSWRKGSNSHSQSLNNSSSDGRDSEEEQNEHIRASQVVREEEFVYFERINGKPTNVLQGLELHTGVFNAQEQRKIVECVYDLQTMGQRGQLRERTYSEPRKWMRGKGRVTIQFGCCYNYAVDKNGNPPGIVRDEEVDPLPSLFKKMIKRMVRWHVLPPSCIPNSCIVNIYEEGDCIPPHIDHHDFVRPFCTVSFLTECNILFGSNLKILSPGEFWGPVSIPLPVGSVLILNGNGADIAKHCVPAVPAKRISITFRKMDDSKMPYRFLLDPELDGINPLDYSLANHKKVHYNDKSTSREYEPVRTRSNNSFVIEKDDFPPLGSSRAAMNGLRVSKDRSRQRNF
ncbi:hypothetical protein RGQ29_032349 [Quercus rubra]|uniref:Fe2OG dioxygenase domain-containing protein n=1 Tax=Quercus rubra TaxID=3512 RepID=A0AAN7DVQ4_QUERU|nr:hypothetical protein RGQ29_032349 [Quercus rubra]